ncbi:MAG: phytanoyl-CoA dioxygenase family protein [Planctomycetes bacterium]|nr:phytanoyl-CoA dioxygenase family protein [Planctomycetota bacterium]
MQITNSRPTPAQEKAHFDTNGYLIVRDILSPAQLSELRTQIARSLAGNEPQFGDFEIQWEPACAGRADLPRSQRIRVMFNLCHRDPWFWGHATRPELVDVVENLIGPDLELYTDQMFVKGPYHGSEVPYHQDSPYWPIEPEGILSCWLAVDDATEENGCVRVIPGSHKQAITHSSFSGAQSLGLHQHQVDAAKEVPMVMSAGSCMFHHSLLIHRSLPNTSPAPRRGLVSIYVAAATRFTGPWDFRYGFKTIRGSRGHRQPGWADHHEPVTSRA